MGEMADAFNDTMGAYTGPTRFQYKDPYRFVCKHCQVKKLGWKQLDSGSWRLVDKDNKIHSCPNYNISTNEE